MAEQPLFPSFQEFIHTNHLVERGEKILVSVSGGIDSMVLLNLFLTLRERVPIEIIVAHFNHQLRGAESDGDEQFVRAVARKHSLECYVETADTAQSAEAQKISIQEIARNLRYDFLVKVRRAHGFQKIATAHTADDNTETMLFNFFRGTGVSGLVGIPMERKDLLIIRPLLFAPRSRILAYSSEHGIRYREDSSNALNKYTRNFIRHDLIPLIREQINPNLISTLNRSGQIFAQLESYLTTVTKSILETIVEEQSPVMTKLKCDRFGDQPEFLRENILRTVGADFCQCEIDFNTVKTMMRIANGETGDSCSLTKDIIFFKNRNHLIFRHAPQLEPFSLTIDLWKSYDFRDFAFESSSVERTDFTADPNIEFIDADALVAPLTMRSWKEGDWFIPFGTGDRKKLSDYFIDMKIPLFTKHSIPILTTGEVIVWVCGMRLDDRFKITPQTKRIVKLQFAQRIP